MTFPNLPKLTEPLTENEKILFEYLEQIYEAQLNPPINDTWVNIFRDQQAVFWDDLRFPVSGINPPGGVNDPDLDPNNGTWLFNANTTEICAIIAQMPHSWREESTIIPHVHWSKTTSASGNVLWRFEYQIAKPGDVFPGTWTTVDTTTTVTGTPDNDTAEEHLISSFGDIDMTGYTISTILLTRISRIGGDASDTYGADARLIEFDIHYEIDGAGSALEFIKYAE